MRVYLDNASTTKLDPEVLKAMLPYYTEKYGNASSLHQAGQEAKMTLEESRKTVAKSINAKPDEIIFTSGGTESNNLALKGLAFVNKGKKNHIIATKIEHDCILNSCKWLESQGFEITYLNVDKDGFVNLDDLENAIKEHTILVTAIHGNNEIGTIQNLKRLGEVCRKRNIYFHTDACQSFTKTELNVKKQNLDLATLNAHKLHGPKGVGALYIREGIKIVPLAHGGGHEFKMRAGTENVPCIVGFATAIKIAKPKEIRQIELLRNYLIDHILNEIDNTKLNGPRDNRLCNNINICFSNIEGEALGAYLDTKGICTSTGSACSSKSLEPSHVLMAIGRTPKEANSSLRMTLSKFNTKEEIDYTLEILPKFVNKLRKMSPFEK